ncbi:excalibur calcium-binding domain-containing protein [Streptomyces bacillaris]
MRAGVEAAAAGGGGWSTYYANCSAVRAAGAAPIRAGQPGYGRHLDRDGDGVACE